MSLKKNMLRGWITTIIGTATMVITLTLIVKRVFDFVPEGIAGLAIGTILILSPKSIEGIVNKWIGAGKPTIEDKQEGGDI